MEALKIANAVRIERAGVKRQIKAGVAKASELVMEPPEFIHSMKVRDLIESVPKVGPVRGGKILKRVGCAPSKTVIGLSERQANALAAEIKAVEK
jgi:hypothetical protein